MAKKTKTVEKSVGDFKIKTTDIVESKKEWISVIDNPPPEGIKVIVFSKTMRDKMDDKAKIENPTAVFFGIRNGVDCTVDKTGTIPFGYWMPCPDTKNL